MTDGRLRREGGAKAEVGSGARAPAELSLPPAVPAELCDGTLECLHGGSRLYGVLPLRRRQSAHRSLQRAELASISAAISAAISALSPALLLVPLEREGCCVVPGPLVRATPLLGQLFLLMTLALFVRHPRASAQLAHEPHEKVPKGERRRHRAEYTRFHQIGAAVVQELSLRRLRILGVCGVHHRNQQVDQQYLGQ